MRETLPLSIFNRAEIAFRPFSDLVIGGPDLRETIKDLLLQTNELLALGVDFGEALRTYPSGYQEATTYFGFDGELDPGKLADFVDKISGGGGVPSCSVEFSPLLAWVGL